MIESKNDASRNLEKALHALEQAKQRVVNEKKKPSLEGLQKYMENGEYLRSIESGEEQNYSFIDGNKNNCKKISGRKSVLKRLPQKQAEIAEWSGKSAQQMVVAQDKERRRK